MHALLAAETPDTSWPQRPAVNVGRRSTMIESLLVANRGEIARRIIRTAKRLGIRTIAVYSEADADLPFVTEADEAVLIGPANPAQSYRNAEAILAAAKSTGAQADPPRLRLPQRERRLRPRGRGATA